MYAKALLPSPMTLLAELIRPENRLNTGRYYPDIEVLSHDIAQTYQKVIREFYNMGCRFLQFSDYTWNLTGGCDIQQISEANNTDLASLSTVLARLTELCLNDKPDDMCISLQFDEKWWNTRDREKIAEILLSTQANAIAFDFGNRENENIDFSILKHCQSKDVILGLVSTSSSQPISTSTITHHIENAARLLPLESLHLSCQGNFRNLSGNSSISEQEMWNKIATMKNIAKIIETQYETNYIIPIIGEMIDKFVSDHLIYIFLNNTLIWPSACKDEKIFELIKCLNNKSEYILTPDKKIGLFPLISENKLLGCIVTKSTDNVLSEKEISYLEQLTNQAATTINRANVYAEILKHATLDALTSLYNRRQLEERIKQEVSGAKRHNRSLCAIMTDIDFFKSVNDTYGHAAGDLVLKTVSE